MKRKECKEIIIKAGKKLIEARDMSIEEKTDFKNLVTSYDKATQEYLIREFSKIIPEATFFCEENNVRDVSGKYTFIIDPIDGTSNFVFHYNMSAISVALASGSDILWGIVYNPFTDELYEAEKGMGAFLNGKPIHVTENDLQHTMVSFGTSPYYEHLYEKTFDIAKRTLKLCVDLRRSGSAALDLCFLARGSYGLFYELTLSPWDYAAGICIIKEAGGVITQFDGSEPDLINGGSILAGTPKTIEQFRQDVLDQFLVS